MTFSVFKNAFILLLVFRVASPQNCNEYYKTCQAFKGKYYQFSDITGGFLLQPGDTTQRILDAIPGIDYSISICSGFTMPLNFNIKNTDGDILYDNRQELYKLNFEFSVKKRQNLIIKLNIPLDEHIVDTTGKCVALIIKKEVKPRTGF